MGSLRRRPGTPAAAGAIDDVVEKALELVALAGGSDNKLVTPA